VSSAGPYRNDKEESQDRRRAYTALTDHALIAEIQAGDPLAWDEFMVRFRAPLEAFAKSSRIPSADWPVCVQEVLEEALVRLSDPASPIPARIAGYLIRMARNEFLQLQRRQSVSVKYSELAETRGRDRVMRCLVSEASRRASGEFAGEEPVSSARAIESLAIKLGASLTAEEEQILTWVSNRIPHRKIAEWMEASYASTTKRIWRLERRLRQITAECRAIASPDEQREIDRYLRRVGVGESDPNARAKSGAMEKHNTEIGERADPE